MFSKIPYIIATRLNQNLIKNLAKDNYPIICEGLHTSGILNYQDLSIRRVFVRTHNVEHDYYLHLAAGEDRLTHRMYYKREAKKLRRYESVLQKCTGIFSISPSDTEHFKELNNNIETVFPFHPFREIHSKSGKGLYAVYHGNLKVNENNKAALFLAEQVFNDLDFPLLITGSGASNYLKYVVSKSVNVELKENIPSAEMISYMQDAHIHILPTFQATGMKLKLISALFNGRYCLVNNQMVVNTGVENLCIVANDADEFKKNIKSLIAKDFPASEIKKRKEVINKLLNNTMNGQKIMNQLFNSAVAG